VRFFFHFFAALVHQVVIALTLIAFGDGVPVLFGHSDAVFLHESVDKVVLTLENRGKAMKRLPHNNVEALAQTGDEGVGRFRGQIKVMFRLLVAEVRYHDSELAFPSRFGHISLRRCLQELFEQTRLNRATGEMDGIVAALVVNEPVSEVVFESYVKADLAHNSLILLIQS